MEWNGGQKTKQNIVYTEIRHNALYAVCCMSANTIVVVDVPARMRHGTTGQCSAVLAGHLINETARGENTLAAINCSLLIMCMCKDVQMSSKYF